MPRNILRYNDDVISLWLHKETPNIRIYTTCLPTHMNYMSVHVLSIDMLICNTTYKRYTHPD